MTSGNPVVVWAITAFASGGMIFMGVFALALYMFRRKEKAGLYFALICVSAAVRFFFMEGSMTILGLAPAFPHSAVYAARYIALGCSIVGITGFIYAYFTPSEKFKKPFKALSALTVAAFVLLAVIAAARDGDNAAMRLIILIPTLGILAFSLFIIVKSPAVKGSRLNQFYLATVVAYMAEAVLLSIFVSRFANLGVVTGSFFVIVHTVMLCERYSSAIEENELLNSLHKSKSDFLNDLNHELRTPLSIITSGVSYANRLLERNGDIEQVRETLDAARDEALHIGRMLDGMTTMAALSDKVDNRERLNLAGVILCVAEGFRRRLESYGVELRITIEPDLPDVFVEREQFRHVILNLMTNAVRYTHFGAVTVSVALSHPCVVVTVADTGEGIAPMLLPTLFANGKSGESGQGNGLYVCKSVVEAHGGVITVQSELHIGTKVTFTVPVYGGQEAGHGKKE